MNNEDKRITANHLRMIADAVEKDDDGTAVFLITATPYGPKDASLYVPNLVALGHLIAAVAAFEQEAVTTYKQNCLSYQHGFDEKTKLN